MRSSEHDQQDKADHGAVHKRTIIVNGQEKVVTSKQLTYEEVVKLAYPTPLSGENVLITVTYRRGEGNKPEGTLVAGESVKLKEGMIFNVRATDKS